jgi:PAS domain-containing protein
MTGSMLSPASGASGSRAGGWRTSEAVGGGRGAPAPMGDREAYLRYLWDATLDADAATRGDGWGEDAAVGLRSSGGWETGTDDSGSSDDGDSGDEEGGMAAPAATARGPVQQGRSGGAGGRSRSPVRPLPARGGGAPTAALTHLPRAAAARAQALLSAAVQQELMVGDHGGDDDSELNDGDSHADHGWAGGSVGHKRARPGALDDRDAWVKRFRSEMHDPVPFPPPPAATAAMSAGPDLAAREAAAVAAAAEDATPTWVAVYDPATFALRRLVCNPASLHLFGWSQREVDLRVNAQHVVRWLHPEDVLVRR